MDLLKLNSSDGEQDIDIEVNARSVSAQYEDGTCIFILNFMVSDTRSGSEMTRAAEMLNVVLKNYGINNASKLAVEAFDFIRRQG